MLEGYLTTTQASLKSGMNRAHIRRLLETGKLAGRKVGRDWLVDLASIEHYMANRPKMGRPRSLSDHS